MTEGQAGSVEMTKPNCTITIQHKETLQELAESRYGTQSGALRAAIDQLAASVSDGETTTNQIITELQEVKGRLGAIEEQLEKETDVSTQTGKQNVARGATPQPTADVAGVFESDGNKEVNDAADDIYQSLLDAGPSRIDELATEIDIDSMTAHRAIESLIEKGMATATASDESQYKLKKPES
jgi:sugar-specific transcriptional regulator TrmB